MLEGLMQNDFPLTLQHVLRPHARYARRQRGRHADGEASAPRDATPRSADRVDRLAAAPARARRRPGDRVGTFAWNTQEHLELYLAVPCMGAVLHTLNIRLFDEQLEYIVNHAEDRVVIVDDVARRRCSSSSPPS